MKRALLNVFVDIMAFLSFALMAATGFILRFALPPGSGGLIGHGRGYGAGERPVMILFGMTRHEWGDLHFWIAVGFVAILALHLFLHWRWIVCTITKQPQTASGFRFALGVMGVVLLGALAASVL